MIKYLLVAVNSIALFLYGLFFDNGPSVKGNFPTNIKPGTEMTAELIVNKGSMGGFAKLQVEVPEGLSVKESDSKGASFSFANGIGKWIWTGVPSEAEFTVKFILVADASATGSKSIGAKYSYVENNNKQVVEMAPVEIMVGDAAPAVATTQPVTTDTPAATTPTESTTARTEPAPTIATGDEPASNVTVLRTITKGATSNDWRVHLKINKDGIRGFARYSDILPEGFTARPEKITGSSFSVSDGKVKFVWVNVPTDPEMEISYILSGTHRDVSLEGEFSYLESNQSKFAKLQPEKLPVWESPAEIKTETPVTETREPEIKTEDPVTETKQPETRTENPVTETSQSGTDTGAPVTETARTNNSNISYCVQIGAYTNPKVSSSKLSGLYGISENIRSEMSGGFTKFMVGKHEEYKEARNHRETVKSKGVNGAFVAAYNGPSRITVQEALMISNQKWLK